MRELREIPAYFIDKGSVNNIFSLIISSFWEKIGTIFLNMKSRDKTQDNGGQQKDSAD
jgi:hypothetical protein